MLKLVLLVSFVLIQAQKCLEIYNRSIAADQSMIKVILNLYGNF